MKTKTLFVLIFIFALSGCVGVSSSGIFGTGVSVALDPRSVGTQIDDSIMQKNLSARIILLDKKFLFSVNSKVLDGRIFLTGKVDDPEEKLKLTKLAWETDGVRSVRNDVKIKENQSKLQRLRFQKALQQLEDPLEIRSLKKEIAQLLTIKNEYLNGIRLDKESA